MDSIVKLSPSIHCNERPHEIVIDTVVIHSMRPFYGKTANQDRQLAECLRLLDVHKVSTHYLVSRGGIVWELVPPSQRAWHAGVSKMPYTDDGRENVNDFSIGIELIEQVEGDAFTDLQYQSLNDLIEILQKTYPLKAIVGHNEIAPGRKTDPGESFDWNKIKARSTNNRG